MKPISKIIILFVVFVYTANYLYAQDIIVTKDLKSIKSKVLEVSNQEIKYLDFENQSGPTYIILKSEIKMIIYQNGIIETFQVENIQNEEENVAPIPNLKTFDELMKLNDYEKELYLSTIRVNSIYEKYKKGNQFTQKGKKLLESGLLLTFGGGVFAGVGIVIMNTENIEGLYIFLVGSTAFSVGQVITLVSIPLSAVGGGLKRTAESQYYDLTLGKNFSSFQPKLNLGLTNNGFGLTLNF